MSSQIAKLLSDESIRPVFNEYTRGMMSCFGIDVMSTRGFINASFLRSIYSFTGRYGIENAVAITKQAFGSRHRGMYSGRQITATMFTTGFDWMSQALLQEVMVNKAEDSKFTSL